MSVLRRPLEGSSISVSISETDDNVERGFPDWQINRFVVQVAAALFGQGATVVFGHDWREDGVMEAVHAFVRQMQGPIPLSSREARAEGQPLLRNVVPWPDEPSLPQDALETLRSTLVVEMAGLPYELKPVEADARKAGPDSPLYRYVRARSLTHLRHRLDEISQARLCMGGRESGYAGRYPGVVEEALFAVRKGMPLYLAGLFGGAALDLVEAVEGNEMPENFCRPTNITSLFKHPPVNELNQSTEGDRDADRRDVWEAFKDKGTEGLSEANGLRIEENRELFRSPALERVIQLVLTGLSRLRTI